MPENTLIATYPDHPAADAAVKALAAQGVDLQKLSIVGKGYHTEEKAVGYYTNGDRMKSWGAGGAFWGGLWGLLAGAAFFVIPGIGPIAIAGPLVTALVGALEGAVVVGGLSALGAGLVGLGLPKDSVVKYEAAIRADKFVLFYRGTEEEVATVREKIQHIGGHESLESCPAKAG